MIKYTFDDGSEYLEHHGILGQKWGKRNGPPYPLSASDHSSSEKKAGWKDSLRNSRGAQRRDIAKAYKADRKALKENQKAKRKKLLDDEAKAWDRQFGKKYKNGGKMSDEDLRKEAELERKAGEKWDKSEKEYKKNLKANKYWERVDKGRTDTYLRAYGRAFVRSAVLSIAGDGLLVMTASNPIVQTIGRSAIGYALIANDVVMIKDMVDVHRARKQDASELEEYRKKK